MKKILIITYYWPPAGGPGVQRWLKFVKYFRDFGIEPHVYIPENPDYPLLDESLVKEIEGDPIILQHKIFEPYALAKIFSRKQTEKISSGIINEKSRQGIIQKLLLYIRGNFFIPDARVLWVKPSVKFLLGYLQKNQIETIVTTGPPHSLHLIGLELKKNLHIRWYADFRDPWTKIGYHKKLKLNARSLKKHVEMESEVLNSADHIITTSFTTKAEFSLITSKPISVITNGFEQVSLNQVERDEKFSLVHIGSLLSGRNPHNLWQVLSELVVESENFKNFFILKLVGTISEEVLRSIREFGLSSNLEIQGYVDHREALKIQRKAQVLLLVEIDSEETRGIIPGKLFEYLAAERPVVAVGPEKWDVERILEDTRAGTTFNYNSYENLKNQILTYFDRYLENTLEPEIQGIDQYSRKYLTGKMADLLKKNQ